MQAHDDDYVDNLLRDLFGDGDAEEEEVPDPTPAAEEAPAPVERLKPNAGFLTRLVKSTDRTNKRLAEEAAAAAVVSKAKAAVATKAHTLKRRRGLQLLNHIATKYNIKVRVFPGLTPTDAAPESCPACGASTQAAAGGGVDLVDVLLPTAAIAPPKVVEEEAERKRPPLRVGVKVAARPKPVVRPASGTVGKTTPAVGAPPRDRKTTRPTLALFKAGLQRLGLNPKAAVNKRAALTVAPSVKPRPSPGGRPVVELRPKAGAAAGKKAVEKKAAKRAPIVLGKRAEGGQPAKRRAT